MNDADTSRKPTIKTLAELTLGDEADFFAQLSNKEELTTRDGKPYWKVTFRDAEREAGTPIWADSPLAEKCRDEWQVGKFYKLRAIYQDSKFGPQLEIRRIREATDRDQREGFDPARLAPRSRVEPAELHEQLLTLAREQISHQALRELVLALLMEHRPALLQLPAAIKNHHAYPGGWLEHTLSVTQAVAWLVNHYRPTAAAVGPPLQGDVAIAGAMLHDLGKVQEFHHLGDGVDLTPAGAMIGHLLQGRDMIREAAVGRAIEPEIMLRLEHVMISHQRVPEGASPRPPMTPEALLVQAADDLDAQLHMLLGAMKQDPHHGPLTSSKNVLNRPVYRGEG